MTVINVFDGTGDPDPWILNEVERKSLDRFRTFIERAAQVWEDVTLRQLWQKIAWTVKTCTQAKFAKVDDLLTMRALIDAVETIVPHENVIFHGDLTALRTSTCMRLGYLGADEDAYHQRLREMVAELLPAATYKPTGTIIIACYEITRTHLSTNYEQITLDSVRKDHYSEMAGRNINDMPWALHTVILYQGKTESLYTFEDVEIGRVIFFEKEEGLRLVMKYRTGHVQDRLLGRAGPNGGKLPPAKKVEPPTPPSPWPDDRSPLQPWKMPNSPPGGPWDNPNPPAQWQPQHEPDEATKEAIRRIVQTNPSWLGSGGYSSPGGGPVVTGTTPVKASDMVKTSGLLRALLDKPRKT